MRIKIVFSGKTRDLELENGSRASDAAGLLGLNTEEVLVKRGSDVIPDDEKLKDGDKIEVLKMVSSG